ncbi:hypothetical protein PTKIN_Ptkin14bG0226000 [Pterospermum kingtungense]
MDRQEGDGRVIINIEDLASSLENEMSNDGRLPMLKHCIFKTPSILLRHKQSAYVPNYFSIGPYHHGQGKTKRAEKIKIKYLTNLFASMSSGQDLLRRCIDSIAVVETNARNCYDLEEEIGFGSEEFVQMLLVDGCFIIELFRKDAKLVPIDEKDPIFSTSFMLQFLYHDLILLENQIPWFILERLFDVLTTPSETKPLVELAFHFFKTTFSSYQTPVEASHFNDMNIKHILDLLWFSLVSPSKKLANENTYLGWQPIHSATRLKESGVKFKKVTSESILDINFNQGVLQIPSLLIQETTETMFRNLISYEQCLPHCRPVFTCYAIILSQLIGTAYDLEILCDKGIVDNWLSLEQATQFFDKLYQDTYVKEFFYSKFVQDLNQFCQSWWPRARAAYVHYYLSKSWIVVVVAAQVYACTMLFLTFLQTFFAIKN